jgi:hypothetical protein
VRVTQNGRITNAASVENSEIFDCSISVTITDLVTLSVTVIVTIFRLEVGEKRDNSMFRVIKIKREVNKTR